jgi:hypothetical protein
MQTAPRWLERLRLAGAACLSITAIYAFLFHLTLPSKLPSESDYEAVANALEKRALPGDGVLLFPWWAERARMFVPGHLPVIGYLGSDSDSLWEHPRVWVLGQPELPRARQATFDAAFLPGRRAVGATERFGPLTLTLYENDRHRRTNFRAITPDTPRRVYVESENGEQTECPWDERAARCKDAFVTGPEWHEDFYKPLLCLHVHPPGGPRRVVVEFSKAPLGDTLTLEGGILWEYAPRQGGGRTPVHMGVEATDVRLALQIPVGAEGLKRVEQKVSATPSDTLRLWVQSDNALDRELCVDVRSTSSLEAR